VPLAVAHLLQEAGWAHSSEPNASRSILRASLAASAWTPADDPRLIAFREMLRKKNPVLMARDRFDDRHRTMARLREAQIEEEHRARERLLWTMRNRASQEWRQQHRARGDIAQTIAGMRADSPDSLADVSRYFDNLPDDDAQVVHGPSAAAPRTRSPQDSEADEDYMQFTQKSDTEAAPERGRSGKPSVYRPKVDITIDSRNIETPPRSRERSPKIPNYDEYAQQYVTIVVDLLRFSYVLLCVLRRYV
jgi:hypothetical protein